jgi:hypothetical protein
LIGLLMWGCSSPVAEAFDSGASVADEPASVLDDPSTDDSTTTDSVSEATTGREPGAWVTTDCTYKGYGYAMDILLSCGSERFDEPLRLHTFKRHSRPHAKVFSDQRITTRDERLWFDAYEPARCVRVAGDGSLTLASRSSECVRFRWDETKGGARLVDAESGQCASLGDAVCTDDRWTGGRECGGVDHRYLPLKMADCSTALTFAWRASAETCADEYPSEDCF